MTGIQGSKEAVDFMAKLAKAAKDALADGFQPSDLASLGAPLMALWPLIKDASSIPSELKDLDATEVVELIEVAVSDLALNEKSSAIVKQAMVSVMDLVKLYELVKA